MEMMWNRLMANMVFSEEFFSICIDIELMAYQSNKGNTSYLESLFQRLIMISDSNPGMLHVCFEDRLDI